MNTYTVKGVAIQCFIKADTLEEAKRILSAPLIEVAGKIEIWFEK